MQYKEPVPTVDAISPNLLNCAQDGGVEEQSEGAEERDDAEEPAAEEPAGDDGPANARPFDVVGRALCAQVEMANATNVGSGRRRGGWMVKARVLCDLVMAEDWESAKNLAYRYLHEPPEENETEKAHRRDKTATPRTKRTKQRRSKHSNKHEYNHDNTKPWWKGKRQ